MRTRWTALASIVALVIELSGTATAVSAIRAGNRPAKQHATAPLVRKPLVGSHRVLVYEQWRSSSSERDLFVRLETGHSRVRSTLSTHLTGWSLARSMLTAIGEPGGPSADTIRWWNVNSHAHGVIVVGQGERYLAAAPDGAVVVDPHGRLRLLRPSGETASLGKPIPHDSVSEMQSSSHGFVLEDRTHTLLRYQTWAHPRRHQTLNDGRPAGYAAHCSNLTAKYVSCAVEDSAALIPLNGHRPVTTVNVIGRHTAIAGSTLFVQSATRKDHFRRLASVTRGSTNLSWSDFKAAHMVSAYGKVVTTHFTRRHHLLVGTTADGFTRFH